MHRKINTEAAFPEGPVWADGRLLYVEYAGHRVTAWDGQTNSTFWSEPGFGPSSIVRFGEGFAVFGYDAGAVVFLSPTGQELRRRSVDGDGGKFDGPNDGVADGKGGLYFTESGPWRKDPIVGRLHYLDRSGALRCVADDLHYPNGAALSADGGTLFVAESEASRIVAFDVGENGRLTGRRQFARMSDLGEAADAYPDGIKMGPDGLLYIGLFNAGRIAVATAEGRRSKSHEVSAAGAPNLAFSGDARTLFVMALDELVPPYRGAVFAIDI